MKQYKNKDWLERKYLKEKLSQTQISEICKTTRYSIRYWLSKYNIIQRSRGEGTHLIKANHCKLSQETINFINGELLGDGCLLSQSPYSARFEYTLKHLEYIEYISSILKSFGIEQSGEMYKKYDKKYNCYSYQYQSLSYVELLSVYKKWYPNDKKIVPKDIKLTPLTCRNWFLGDGYLGRTQKGSPYIKLYTDGFSIRYVDFLLKKLTDLGFKVIKQLHKNANFNLYISTYSTKAFLDFIGKCPVQCYQYKFATKGE